MTKPKAKMFSFSSKLWFNKRRIAEKTGEASLYLQAVINSRHKEFPLKLKWPVEKIDLLRGELLPRKRGDPDVNDYNLIILTETAKHTEILRTYRIKNINIDIKRFSQELKAFDNKDSFMAYMHNKIVARLQDKEIERKTYQNQMSTLVHMREYDPDWLYNNLSIKYLTGFKRHLINQKFEPGHIWSRIKDVKTYMQLAAKEPLLHIDEEIRAFPNPEPKWKTSYLNKEELRRLMIMYRQGYLSSEMHQVLCAFIFTCLTSLRISDVYRVNSNWRVSNDQLSFIPKKGEKRRKWLHIPLMPMATHFITNIEGRYFNLPSEVEYNRILKDIAVKANINKNITSHLGRHTFGYLYMTTIGNLKGLQEILGHTKTATTERYAHLDEEYKLDSVKKMQADFSDLIMWKAQ
jgi:integrase/recombinase XerD